MTSPNTLSAAVTNAVLYQLMNIHTAFPAKIVSYDYTTRKASVQPMVDKKYRDGTVQAMPQLNNIPVVMPQSNTFFMSFPVNPGDTCLVVCCERAIDVWLQSADQLPPNDPRKFDLSDGVAIMGLSPFSLTSQASSNDEVVIGYKGSTIKIRSNGDIILETASKIALGTGGILGVEVLDALSKALGYIANPVGVVVPAVPFTGPLVDAAAAAALKVQIDAIKATI